MPELTRGAKKDLDWLPVTLSTKARELIKRLDGEPNLGKKLLGRLEGKRSARLGRSHRIIYTASSGCVVVLAVRARKDAYH